MNEVEKMYENVELNRDCNLYKHFTECPMKHTQCEDCENFIYPPFTAEKQLELYKYLCKPFLITTRYYFDEFSITAENTFEWKTMTKVSATGKTYEECIAKLVNNLWQDLTDAERKQIKEILSE
jgi:hypothetical protein